MLAFTQKDSFEKNDKSAVYQFSQLTMKPERLKKMNANFLTQK